MELLIEIVKLAVAPAQLAAALRRDHPKIEVEGQDEKTEDR